MAEIKDLTLTEAAVKIRRREVSPVELVDQCIERIECSRSYGTYISWNPDRARAVARAYEEMQNAGHIIGPLHGLPIALKDNISVAGEVTTAGSRILKDWKPDQDATVTAKLKAAGAIVIGKTNCHEFAWGGTSDNPHYGAVKNAWDASKFPAGSSGGSAVAVAHSTCLGALGTDTGGSVRLPAAVNGIVGLRPTIGRVSNAGVIPLAWSMDTVGPMSRTVTDCALMLNVIAGFDERDMGTSRHPTTDYTSQLGEEISGLRIGVIPEYFFGHLQIDVESAVRGAISLLEQMGATVIEVDEGHIQGNIAAQLTIESAEPSTYHQRWLRDRAHDYGRDVRTLLDVGELLLATHYLQAQRYRSLLRREFMEAFKRVDVFICPTLPFTATNLGASTVEIVPGQSEDLLSSIMQFTGVSSLTGLPSLSVTCGYDTNGLPIGMQIMGPPFAEHRLFKVGAAYQSATAYHLARPEPLSPYE